MRLKSIKLAGFKSFVDATTVNFPTNMAAVVGPNGCGKSNIIDAVRWVMGESSAKNLRGESMTDVIFNGSNSRKPLGQASIELVFDNSDGTLTGEYAGFSEISIKRLVTREADNTYFLNGTKCRRKDITDIFLGTGLGPRSYAIIEQGMISRLIEAKPEELRVYVEEAAGISKYKERRRDTENRIRRTRENLERLTDIREELERQLQHLKRQARTAERYREYKEEERQLDAEYMALQWRDLNLQGESQGSVIRDLEVKLEASLTERQAADTAIEKLRTRLVEQTDTFNAVQGEYYRLGADIARGEQQIQHQKERDVQLRQDLQQTTDNLQESQQHIEQDRERLEAWREEIAQIEPDLDLTQATEEESAQALESAEQSMTSWQQRWDEFNQSSSEPRRQAEVQQSRIQHLDQVVQRLGDRLQKLQQEAQGIELGDDEQAVMALQEQLAEVELQAETLEQQQGEIIASIEDCRAQTKQTEAELEGIRGSYQQKQGRLASLEALQQAAMSQDESTGAWVQASGLGDKPRLADQLQVSDGWERAVEAVLGDYLQAVSVDSIEQLQARLSDSEGVRLSLVDSSPAPASSTSASLTPLLDKVSGSNAAGGLLAGIYCADSLSAALSARGQLGTGESIVTSDGLWLGSNWLRVVNQQDETAGVLERQRELESLGQDIATIGERIETLEASREEQADKLHGLEEQRQQVEHQLREAARDQSRLSSELSANRVRVEQALVQKERVERETADTHEQIAQEQENLSESRELLQTALDTMEQDEEIRENLLQERDETRSVLDRARQRARHDKDTAHQMAMRYQSLKTQSDSVEQAITRLEGQLTMLSERKESLSVAIEENIAPIDELAISLEANLEERVKVEGRLAEARRDLEAIEFEMREHEEARNKAEQSADSVRGRLEQKRLESRTVEVQRKALQDKLAEGDFEPQALLETLAEDAQASQWQENLERLGNKITRLGPINLAAIDEYQSSAERKHYLDEQNADLEEALETLEGAIRKIDKETRTRFKETFDEINTGLQELFPRVFGGGQAYLELTGDDLLDTGIAIMARPPGKRNSTIHLLSGGEKALTALALVFSIFQLNPAPFCMLDEVDAPLDDANVGRYARMVKEMSEHVQFIYITHNKITMEYADQLMGVTMQEAGCSRLVTVDVDEAAEMAAV